MLATIPEGDRVPSKSIGISDNEHPVLPSLKTLGVIWDAGPDTFRFLYQSPEDGEYTRRMILKRIASIFDPSGQLSPFTIRARVLFQESWLLDQGWDDPLPEQHQGSWSRWFGELPDLNAIEAPRCFKDVQRDGGEATLSVHIFCDASDNAFAAASYVRAEYEDGTG